MIRGYISLEMVEKAGKRVDMPLQKLKIEGADSPEFRSIATSYTHPEVLYVSYANLRVADDSISIGVAKSIDYGETWSMVWSDVNNVPSENRESGWLDERFGSGWGENPFHMTIDENDPGICYATDFGRTIKNHRWRKNMGTSLY